MSETPKSAMLPAPHSFLPSIPVLILTSLSFYTYFLPTPLLPFFSLFFPNFEGGKTILFFLGSILSRIRLPLNTYFSDLDPLSPRTETCSASLSNHSGAVSGTLGSSETTVVVSREPSCLALDAYPPLVKCVTTGTLFCLSLSFCLPTSKMEVIRVLTS